MAYRHPVTKRFISKADYEALTNAPKSAPINFKSLMADYSPQAITGMVQRIGSALADREAFERAKAPHGSHIELRRTIAFMRNNRGLAAFLMVLGADPDHILNRSRKDGYRSNLKGLNGKLKNLYEYCTGKTLQFERTSLALFAATIIAANRGVGWISNTEQELVLSSVPVTSLPKEVADAIEKYKHKYMSLTGDSRNQSCQWRTTYDNLGCYFVTKEDTEDENRNGVCVNMDNLVIRYLNERWNLDAVS